jgi:hypothetical protein
MEVLSSAGNFLTAGMNTFSKTDMPCDCGWISSVINEPDSPVVFDEKMNHILLVTAQSQYPLYHCPFCGGTFPDRAKRLWVPKIPPEEFARVEKMAKELTSREAILSALGTPDHIGNFKTATDADSSEYYLYENVSEFIFLEFHFFPDGRVLPQTTIKSLSPRHAVAE